MKNSLFKPTDSEGQNGAKAELLKIAIVRYDCGTQSRAAINEEVVADYAERLAEGDKFPALEVFHDGSDYFLADGFHRIMAAIRNGFLDFPCNVYPGTRSDALKFALSANAMHGLKRTNADKRRSVELALEEWADYSNREIARICAVHHDLVASVRHQVADSATCPLTHRGADGKQYPATSKATPAPSVADERLETNGKPKSHIEDDERPRIKTYDEEIAEMELSTGEPAEPKERIRYHIELVIADAQYLLELLDSNAVERAQLEHIALEQALSSKLLTEFATEMIAPVAHN